MDNKNGAKKIQKHLCVQYDVALTDVELLMQDLAENVESLAQDLATALDNGNWQELHSVGLALQGLRENVDVNGLKEIADRVVAAASEESKDVGDAVRELAELGGALRPKPL